MSKSSMLKWINEGQITIPSVLLSQYHKMKLNESELVLLLQLISIQTKGNDFPTPVELSSR